MKRPRWLLVPLLLAMFMLTACDFVSCNTPAPKPANQPCPDGFEEGIRDDTLNGAKNLILDQEQFRTFDKPATDITKPETGDVDLVKVNLVNTQIYTFRTYDLGMQVATRLSLSYGGSIVAWNEIDQIQVTSAKSSRIDFRPKESGMYVLQVVNLYGKGGCGPDHQYKLIATAIPVPTITPTVTVTPKATSTPTVTPTVKPTSGATPTTGPTSTASKVKITDWTSVTVNGKEVAVLYPPAEVIIAEITGVKYIKGTWWTQTSRIQGNSITSAPVPSGEPCSVVAMNPEKDPGQVLHVLANLKKASVLEGAMASGIKNPNQIRNGQTIVFPHCGEANQGDTALFEGSDIYTYWLGTITGEAPVDVLETKGNFSRVEPVGWVLGSPKPAIKLEKVPTPLSPLKPTPTSGKPKP